MKISGRTGTNDRTGRIGRTGRTGRTGRKGMHVCMFVLVYFKSFPVYLYVYNSVCEILCMHVRVLILCTGKRLRIYA